MATVANLVCSFVGLVVLMSFFLNIPVLTKLDALLINWGVVVAGLALGVGAINLIKRQVSDITKGLKKDKRDWGTIVPSAAGFLMLIAVTVVGVTTSSGSNLYKLGVAGILEPCQETISTFITFYIATSAFRAFRIRNLEAALLLIAGVVVMLGQAPIATVIHERLPEAAEWLMQVVNVGGQRGIIISAALGMIVAGLRVLLGTERGPWKS